MHGVPLCDCAQVSVERVDAAFAAGARDVDDVTRLTGAGGGCGGCRPEIRRRLGRLRWRARLARLLGR